MSYGLKFKKLSGDINWSVYGGKFVSKRLNNGDFDFWFVLDVINMWEATGDETIPQYAVSLLAVSPASVSKEDLDRAFGSCGFSDDEIENESNVMLQVEALADYGIFAHLWDSTGNNIAKLMHEAHQEANHAEFLFGFYMDRRENRLGQTGWDLIKGQSMREFFAERKAD